MKKNYILTTLLATLLLSGCSSDNKEEQKASTSATASSIAIEKGSGKLEQKVASKEYDDKALSYYGNYGDKDTREAKKPRTVLDANINIRSPYERVQISMMAKKLSKNFILKCSACHDDYANGIIGPSLLGKSPEFIEEKIAKFKNDKTANVLMSELVSSMGDDEIKSLANEIHTFNEEIKKLGENNAN